MYNKNKSKTDCSHYHFIIGPFLLKFFRIGFLNQSLQSLGCIIIVLMKLRRKGIQKLPIALFMAIFLDQKTLSCPTILNYMAHGYVF